MTDLLKDAEARARESLAARQAEETAAVESVREEIGPATYEKAKEQLPLIEKAIHGDFLPWVARIRAIAQRSGDFPRPIGDAVATIEKLSADIPRQLRVGIAGWEGFNFSHLTGKDGRLDVNRRASQIAGTRQLLRSFDGALSAMKQARGQAEHYIREAEWPRRPGVPAMTGAVAPPEKPAEGLRVETRIKALENPM